MTRNHVSDMRGPEELLMREQFHPLAADPGFRDLTAMCLTRNDRSGEHDNFRTRRLQGKLDVLFQDVSPPWLLRHWRQEHDHGLEVMTPRVLLKGFESAGEEELGYCDERVLLEQLNGGDSDDLSDD
ncbi:hypothetical protein MBLNU230_g7336t1 [Neophaeotheca triangularis]